MINTTNLSDKDFIEEILKIGYEKYLEVLRAEKYMRENIKRGICEATKGKTIIITAK